MSEPIILWDGNGREVTVNSPSEAQRLVLAGELFTVNPAIDPTITAEPTFAPVTVETVAKRTTKRKEA